MSFTTDVKNEVTKLETSKFENIAEIATIISLSSINTDVIKITTENYSVARRVFSLFKNLLNINMSITVRKGFNYSKKPIFILQTSKVDLVLNEYPLENNLPKQCYIEDEECKRAFLRAVFVMNGSINDPKKSRYHLEFLLNDFSYAEYLNNLLNQYYLNSKILKRENKYMVYIKEAEKISDFLRIIKSFNAVLYYEDIRIYRDHKNMTNRLNNCEQANVDKIINTALEQVKQIEAIQNKVGLELLDEKEQVVALYRLKYPEVSLVELSEIISLETEKKITKSGIYHRFKKIKELYERIK